MNKVVYLTAMAYVCTCVRDRERERERERVVRSFISSTIVFVNTDASLSTLPHPHTARMCVVSVCMSASPPACVCARMSQLSGDQHLLEQTRLITDVHVVKLIYRLTSDYFRVYIKITSLESHFIPSYIRITDVDVIIIMTK